MSAFDAEAYYRTGKTHFKFTVDEHIYQCWCARPLRRVPANWQWSHVVGYQLGDEVHIVRIAPVITPDEIPQ